MMPVDGKEHVRTEDGVEKHSYTVEFSNGALQQLKELATFLKTNDLVEVVKVGISVIENAKQSTDKRNVDDNGK